MSLSDPCLIRSRGPSGEPVVRLGMPLVDDYLDFLDGRCRPHTVLAAAYDLRVFFGVVGKPAEEVRATDVLGFITAQRSGLSGGARLQPVDAGEENHGSRPAPWPAGCRPSLGSSPTSRPAAT
jgi:integrase/recombinase XerD